jgi:hypothetical protein
MSDALELFHGKRYFNLESYRRDATPVRTPLWFVERNGELAIYTMEASGKVKRLRRNRADARQVYALLDRKYGWQRALLNFFVRLRPHPRACYAIRLA